MSFAMGGQPPPQQSPTADLFLRYPDNIGLHAQIPYDQAVAFLSQAAEMAFRVPFTWTYIDKPPDGQAYLVFIPQPQAPLPPDGIRWLEQEKSFRLPAGGRELEVCEIRYGFIPGGAEQTASRMRRRYRLTKGGNTQIFLLHYLRSDPAPIPPQLISAFVRTYPLRPIAEPRVFVAGERMGQRVQAGQPNGVGIGPTGLGGGAPMPGGHVNPMAMNPGMNVGLGLGIGAAALAQQNQAMDAMERERRRAAAAAAGGGAGAGIPAAGVPPTAAVAAAAASQRVDEDDSGDEYEPVSTRTLAIERFKRNHELMAEIFTQASKGNRKPPVRSSPYASLDLADMNAKVEKLNAEVSALEVARRANGGQ